MVGIIICTVVVFGVIFAGISAGGAVAVTAAATWLSKGPAVPVKAEGAK